MFRVELPALAPLPADCKLVSIPGGEEIIVECKIGQYRIKSDGPSRPRTLQHMKATRVADRMIFTWRSQWDYIYTKHSRSRKALFIPRDRIPKKWWNQPSSEGSGDWLQWPATDDFARYEIDIGTDQSLVKGIERILEGNPLKAMDPIPLAHVSPESMSETDTRADTSQQMGLGERLSAGNWYENGFDRGFGSHNHGSIRAESYRVWAAEALSELCRSRQVSSNPALMLPSDGCANALAVEKA